MRFLEESNRLFFTSQLVTLVLTTFTGATVILTWLTVILVLNIIAWILWKDGKCLRGIGYWALSLSPYPLLILLIAILRQFLWKLD